MIAEHNNYLRQQAEDLCQKGMDLMNRGQVVEAMERFRQSLNIFPTAKAHTCLGWVYSRNGKPDLAIRECFLAMELAPELGNPLNDVGAYLVQQDKIDEAELWFRKAIAAPDYEARHFAHANLARILQRRGQWYEALSEFDKALELQPNHLATSAAKVLLQAMMN